jgi:hypothetical protein
MDYTILDYLYSKDEICGDFDESTHSSIHLVSMVDGSEIENQDRINDV